MNLIAQVQYKAGLFLVVGMEQIVEGYRKN